MCGRYVRESDKQKLAEHFRAKPNPAGAADAGRGLQRSADDAPANHPAEQRLRRPRTDPGTMGPCPVLHEGHQGRKGLSTINARSETITKAPTWREPFKKRRCLVPVSGFYEWGKFANPPKQPYAFELSNSGTFAFAGLWDACKDREGHWLQSFAIVTTEANELMAPIHPRMPVILHARDYDRWLDREETERLPLDLLRPFESEAMEIYAANPKVGNVRNNGPELMRAALKAAESGELPL